MSSIRLGGLTGVAAALMLFTAAVAPSEASAQMMDFNKVDATPKGTIGLGMVGAELGFAIPALAGLDDWWAFVVFPTVGAAGGAVGGFYAIDNNNQPEAAVAVLSFGMAMIVPTMVVTLQATAYDPEEEMESSGGSGSGEGADQGEDSARRRRLKKLAEAGGGLLRLSDERLMLGMPGVAVSATYSREELQRYGAEQRTEVHVPLFTGSF